MAAEVSQQSTWSAAELDASSSQGERSSLAAQCGSGGNTHACDHAASHHLSGARASVFLNTGDVRESVDLLAAVGPSTQDEVLAALRSALASRPRKHETHGITEIDGDPAGAPRTKGPLPPTSYLLVKLFVIGKTESGFARDAVARALAATHASHIDTLVLSLAEPHQEWDTLLPIWKEMEEEAERGRVRTLGVADFSLPAFQTLLKHASAHAGVHAPIVNSLSIRGAHREMCEWARERKEQIRLLAHDDEEGAILTAESLTSALSEQQCWCVGECVCERACVPVCEPLWVARYSVVDSPRNTVTALGYLVAGARA